MDTIIIEQKYYQLLTGIQHENKTKCNSQKWGNDEKQTNWIEIKRYVEKL